MRSFKIVLAPLILVISFLCNIQNVFADINDTMYTYTEEKCLEEVSSTDPSEDNRDGPHYFFNKKNTIYAKMLICQDIVELNQKQIYIM